MPKSLPISTKPYRGNLFSAHYLENKLPHGDYWRGIEEENDKAFEKIRELYKRKADFLEQFDEAQLEDDFIRPILKFLGHIRDVQPPILTSVGMENKPDYAFFGSEEAKRKAIELRNARKTDEYYRLAVGIGEAKHWNVDLDTGRRENPSVKISKYLRLSLVPWGILTNGRYWRIYSREVGFSSNLYYEVNLPSLLEHATREDFKYFYGFFSHRAFVRENGQCFLDRVFNESIKFAKGLEDDLKKNVYECLKKIAKGFLESNNDLVPTKENIKEIHKNTLILLYRFLFIFYAEARGLLPLNNIHYKNYSIQKLRDEIAEKLDKNEPFVLGDNYWHRLGLLFKLLNIGAKGLGISYNELPVPPYNGGLFRPRKFLEKYTINDKYLAEAIDLLSRRSGEGGKGYVDYSTLSIRHLGSIYEGLLEYKLKIAEDDLVEDKVKGKHIYRKAREGESPDVYKNELYLVTDKGERKATGTYYTPDYIVKYIVENTLEPIVEEKAEKVRNNGDLLDELLSIKVLDPAMGSGHFLVEVTNFLANKIIEKLEEAGMEDIPELNKAKRLVVERCIYGVDLNPLATELAKVSLWLETVASDKPLSFLDHHLQCGNSLIGARFEDLATAKDKAQVTLFSNTFNETARRMIKKRMQIEKLSSDTIENVEEKEKLLKEVTQLRQRFKEVLDIYTSKYFGNDVPSSEFNNLILSIGKDEKIWNEFRSREWFTKALKISDEKRFFNWELRFPEIFFDEYGSTKDNPGFDVVIGNPPYFSISTLPEEERKYLNSNFSEVFAGNSDILYYFLALIGSITANGKYLGYIVSRYFQEAKYAAKLRKFLSSYSHLVKHVDFLNYQVFGADVNVLACISIFKKIPPKKDSMTHVLKITDDKASQEQVSIAILDFSNSLFERFESSSPYFSEKDWQFMPSSLKKFEEKFESQSIPLSDIATVVKSMETGKNEVLAPTIEIIKKFKIEKELIHHVAKSGSIVRYNIEEENRRIIWTEGIELSNYPKLEAYLTPYKEELSKRHDIKARKANWWEISNPRNANLFFSDYERILVPFMATGNKFCVDTEKHLNDGGDIRAIFFNKDSNISPYYVCAILNSKAAEKYHKTHSKLKRGGYYEYYEGKLSLFPIRRVSFTTPQEERNRLIKELKFLHSSGNFDEIHKIVQNCLPKDKEGNFITEKEKSDVVHDFLAFLAKQMIDMKKDEHKLENALDLFKYLPTDIPVDEFPTLFRQEIKYARVLEDIKILNWPHEINDLWLCKKGDEWILKIELKLRNGGNHKKFQKEGNKIKKEWYKIYAFDIDNKKAEYYQAIFENLNDFENVKIPRGYKKKAKEKLFKLKLPIFDDSKVMAIKPYLEIRAELLELRDKIDKTDWLIDQVVYRLYGLTEEEIKIVEGVVG